MSLARRKSSRSPRRRQASRQISAIRSAATASTDPRPNTPRRLSSVRVTSRPWALSHWTTRSWSAESGKYFACFSPSEINSPRAMRACIPSKFLILRATSKVMPAALSPRVRTVRVMAGAPGVAEAWTDSALRLPGKDVRACWGVAAQTGAQPKARLSNRRNRGRIPFTGGVLSDATGEAHQGSERKRI